MPILLMPGTVQISGMNGSEHVAYPSGFGATIRKLAPVFLLTGNEREEARLRSAVAPVARVRVVSDLSALPSPNRRNCIVVTLSAAQQAGGRLDALRRDWSIVLVYPAEDLLEISQFLDIADSWACFVLFERQPAAVISLAAARYAVIPAGVSPHLGLDELRMGRLSKLPERDFDVMSELGTGATNRQIAERLAMSEEAVTNSLRYSMSRLCVRNRIQAAVLRWRYDQFRRRVQSGERDVDAERR